MTAVNPFDISGKAAIVTGAAMGIGFGIARRFVESGAHVLLADVNEEALHEAVGRLEAGPGKVVGVVVDVAREEAGQVLAARGVESFGGVDVLVNNAGVYPMSPLLQMTPEVFDRIHQVNVRGTMFVTKAVAARMVEQGRGGSIIHIASTSAFHPSGAGVLAYSSSKAAVNMLVRGMALELARYQIRVNAIAPGFTETEGINLQFGQLGMTREQMEGLLEQTRQKLPLGRTGKPEDMANAALFLASPGSSYVTGTTLVVDGGLLLA